MAKIEITFRSVGSCRVVHAPSATSLTTELPPEYGGSGASFSATDLLAAALGVCIATNIDTIAVRYGIPLNALSLTVDKKLSRNPKRLEALSVTIHSIVPVTGEVIQRLERAAEQCVVHRSLHPEVKVSFAFEVVVPSAGLS